MINCANDFRRIYRFQISRWIHCVIHRQHLAAKRLHRSLHTSLNLIICVINKIKANAKNDQYLMDSVMKMMNNLLGYHIVIIITLIIIIGYY